MADAPPDDIAERRRGFDERRKNSPTDGIALQIRRLYSTPQGSAGCRECYPCACVPRGMLTALKAFTETVALGCELIAVLLIATGAVEAAVRLGLAGQALWRSSRAKKAVWLGFASWLLLSLEFTLAADVVRTAIAPTWDSIGQLAAIAGVRTLLNFFLARDLEDADKEQTPA